MIQILTSVIYMLLIVNFIASAGTEALASLFRWRAKILFQNLKIVLNDPVTGLASEIYRDVSIHPRSSGDSDSAEFLENLPSYIDPKDLARALISALGLEQAYLTQLIGKTRQQIETWIEQNVPALRRDTQMRKFVAEMIDVSKGDLDALADVLATWYERTSDRIAGAYKRRTQISNVVIALVLAVTFDLNPLPPVIAALSQATSEGVEAAGFTIGPTPSASVPSAVAAADPTRSVAAGGGKPATMRSGMRNTRLLADRLLGWVITALSSLFGAPFWFGILSRFTNVRGTGSPPPKTNGSAEPRAPPTSAPLSPQTAQQSGGSPTPDRPSAV